MLDNYLKLNTSKTEIMVMSPRQHLQNTPIEHVTFGEEILVPSTKVKKLGVTLDSFLNMEEHVNKLCRSVNFHLRNIWKIRKYINKKCTETLVHALISSRVHYCNLLFSKMPFITEITKITKFSSMYH